MHRQEWIDPFSAGNIDRLREVSQHVNILKRPVSAVDKGLFIAVTVPEGVGVFGHGKRFLRQPAADRPAENSAAGGD